MLNASNRIGKPMSEGINILIAVSPLIKGRIDGQSLWLEEYRLGQ
ncbi:hypothetical protein THIOSC15_2640003 [uncultured Thiomicrorhabdus sp.]